MSAQNIQITNPALPFDTSDVPAVALRELAVALKIVVGRGRELVSLLEMSEDDMRRIEEVFWQRCNRDRLRKLAVLLRLRSFLDACQARSLKSLIDVHGQKAVMEALAAAATMRLNTTWGFNPRKLALAVQFALKGAEPQAA